MCWIKVLPLHGLGGLVVLTDIAHELPLEIRDRGEHATGDDIALDPGKPPLDRVEPGGVCRGKCR